MLSTMWNTELHYINAETKCKGSTGKVSAMSVTSCETSSMASQSRIWRRKTLTLTNQQQIIKVRHFPLLDMILNCQLYQSPILITDFSDILVSLSTSV